MSDLADKIRELPIKHSLDCLGYPDCDGDLVSEPHSEKCLKMSECVSREVVLGLVAERESVLEEVFKHAQALVRLYDDEDASWQAESDVEHSLKEAVKKAAAERQMKRESE